MKRNLVAAVGGVHVLGLAVAAVVDRRQHWQQKQEKEKVGEEDQTATQLLKQVALIQ